MLSKRTQTGASVGARQQGPSAARPAAALLQRRQHGAARCLAPGPSSAGTTTSSGRAPSTQQSPPPPQRRNIVTDRTIADLRALLGSLYDEHAYWIRPEWVEGAIPPELEGTYFRNGPGLQVRNPRYARHAFDADGMVMSLSFRRGRAFFRNRFVRTAGFVDEQAAGVPLYRSAFTRGAADGSPWFNPFDTRLKNTANTSVLHWGGRLLALFENGLPHELNPETLDTLGETRLGGAVDTSALGAHYRTVTQPDGSRRYVTFAVTPGARFEVAFYEFDEALRLLAPKQTYVLPNSMVTLVHDIAVTPNFYVLVEGPISFNPITFGRYLCSRASLAECMAFDRRRPTRVHLVPRPDSAAARAGQAPRVIEVPRAFFSFHHANAYELHRNGTSSDSNAGPRKDSAPPGNGRNTGSNNADGSTDGSCSITEQMPGNVVVLDTLGWDGIDFGLFNYSVFDCNFTPEYYEGGARMHLLRVVLRLDTGTASVTQLARRTLEFPSVNAAAVTGRPHTHVYAGGDAVDDDVFWAPLQTLCKLSMSPAAGVDAPLNPVRDVTLQTWFAGERCFVLEPVFVPRAASTRVAGSAGHGTAAAATAAATAAANSALPAGEDDGWVIGTLYNAESDKGEVVIFDARNIAAGPLARIRLPHFLPSGLHGCWSPECFAPPPGEGDGLSHERPLNRIRAL